MKTIISLLVALLVSITIIACKKEQQTTAPAPAENAAVATEQQADTVEQQADTTEEQADTQKTASDAQE